MSIIEAFPARPDVEVAQSLQPCIAVFYDDDAYDDEEAVQRNASDVYN